MDLQVRLTEKETELLLQASKYRNGHDSSINHHGFRNTITIAIRNLNTAYAESARINGNTDAWNECSRLVEEELNDEN